MNLFDAYVDGHPRTRLDRITDAMALDPYHEAWDRYFAEERALREFHALDEALVGAYRAADCFRDLDDVGEEAAELCAAIAYLRGVPPPRAARGAARSKPL